MASSASASSSFTSDLPPHFKSTSTPNRSTGEEEEPFWSSTSKRRQANGTGTGREQEQQHSEQEEEEDDDDDEEEEQDHPTRGSKERLYAVLNLEKDCTPDQIQKAYKRLADRHRNPQFKPAADSRFQSINHAFEILNDPKKRAIYDQLGESGLKLNWELGQKHKTPQELRAEFEKQNQKQLQADVERLVKSKGELTILTDARVLFLSDEHRRSLGGPAEMNLWGKISTVQTRQLFLKHSFVNPITPSTSIHFTSQLLTRQGAGGGNVIAKIVHNPSSKLSLEIGTTLLRPRSMPLKATYTPDSDSFISLQSSPKTFTAPPIFALTLGRRIFDQTTAIFTVRTGQYSLFAWGKSSLEPVSSSTVSFALQNNRGWVCSLMTGLQSSQISTEWSKVVLGGVKLTLGGALTNQVGTGWAGTMVSTYVSGDRRLTDHVRAGLTLDLAMNGVMTFKLRLNRLGQRITIPILLSSNWDSKLILGFTLVPTLGIVAANHFVITPQKKKKLSSRIKQLRKEHSEYILEKRKEAQEANLLLTQHVTKKVQEEETINGLIIDRAWYGLLKSFPSTAVPVAAGVMVHDDESNQTGGGGGGAQQQEQTSKEADDESSLPTFLDVRIALQSLVHHSQLIIPSGRTKANLLGFYDCAYGENKVLLVEYRFKGNRHRVLIRDKEGLAMPLRGHLIQE